MFTTALIIMVSLVIGCAIGILTICLLQTGEDDETLD